MEKVTRKKKLGGYPAFGVVLSISLALFFIGMLGLLISYYQGFEQLVRENISIKAYLKSSLSETQRNQIEQTLASKEFAARTEKPVTFVPREEAEKELVQQIGNYKEVLGENPFKDVFIVKVDPMYHDTLSLNKIKAEVETIGGVLDAEYEKIYVDTINRNFSTISLVLMVIAFVFIVSVIILINNTIRLALFSQRFLIRSMQLVGATKWFIQRPFLWRATLYGIVAGMLASAALYGFSNYGYKKVEHLIELYNRDHFIILVSGIVLLGIIIAVTSTYFSIRKYLKMSLDELY